MLMLEAIGFGIALALSAYSTFQNRGNLLSIAVTIIAAVLFLAALNVLGVSLRK